MTGPTNWPEIEETDLFRYTLAGIRNLAVRTGLDVLELESRASIELAGARLSLGWGLVARANPDRVLWNPIEPVAA
jgi:hypothetical protein